MTTYYIIGTIFCLSLAFGIGWLCGREKERMDQELREYLKKIHD